MRTKIEIECTLAEEMQHLDDPNHPMNEMEWANNKGWIEALEWVLFSEEEQKRIVQRARLDAILLTQEERENIIKNVTHRIKEPRE